MSYVGPCAKCGETVRSSQTHVFRVSGYEETREGGGANKIMEKTREPNLVWHKTCWELWLRAIPGQGTFL